MEMFICDVSWLHCIRHTLRHQVSTITFVTYERQSSPKLTLANSAKHILKQKRYIESPHCAHEHTL